MPCPMAVLATELKGLSSASLLQSSVLYEVIWMSAHMHSSLELAWDNQKVKQKVK